MVKKKIAAFVVRSYFVHWLVPWLKILLIPNCFPELLMMETVSTCRSVRTRPDAETFWRSSICSQGRRDKWHCGHWQWCPHHLENWLIVIWGLDCFTGTRIVIELKTWVSWTFLFSYSWSCGLFPQLCFKLNFLCILSTILHLYTGTF